MDLVSLLEYASDVCGSFWLSQHWRTREANLISGHLSLLRHGFPMMANPQSKFQSMIWQRKGFCSRWIMTISITIFGMLFLQCIMSYYFTRCKSRRYIFLFPKQDDSLFLLLPSACEFGLFPYPLSLLPHLQKWNNTPFTELWLIKRNYVIYL